MRPPFMTMVPFSITGDVTGTIRALVMAMAGASLVM